MDLLHRLWGTPAVQDLAVVLILALLGDLYRRLVALLTWQAKHARYQTVRTLAATAVHATEQVCGGGGGEQKRAAAVRFVLSHVPKASPDVVEHAVEAAVQQMNEAKNAQGAVVVAAPVDCPPVTPGGP